jgi:hypothetical protein
MPYTTEHRTPSNPFQRRFVPNPRSHILGILVAIEIMKSAGVVLVVLVLNAAHAETSLRGSTEYEARIVGGQDAEAGAYPFMGKNKGSGVFVTLT